MENITACSSFGKVKAGLHEETKKLLEHVDKIILADALKEQEQMYS